MGTWLTRVTDSGEFITEVWLREALHPFRLLQQNMIGTSTYTNNRNPPSPFWRRTSKIKSPADSVSAADGLAFQC